jgi:hypothetical protein
MIKMPPAVTQSLSDWLGSMAISRDLHVSQGLY